MLYIASDHGGYKLKKYLLKYFKNQFPIDCQDVGPFEFDEKDDYPDYASALAVKLAKNPKNQGILICGSGNGICMAANKHPKTRAILGYSIEAAELGRRHNDANVLCLAGRVLTDEHAVAIVKKFLQTDFEGGRHQKRLEKIAKIEK
ncbi:MAG: ribose 5-phosphate isomerase B [Candidatus Magasanikbacteria bacterium CG10_big_fil_rev_8_21_14_0_10_40_10]|uniref:Ribose 5-phosphate isomerase B n=1 Tax=Candidatus Magasanikbacteria bacterium CG10_big_fil_rev_8_21_14_0_10_40_10 TaxID=1974648 RepID=A0A2M6W3X0_9BACT|nr:MAG: ribose 5-phosphate isomerase B [Candidatus Magasanikbacteria bacterium CG10_big_fil_rev_8_21_14_0_10_40_10]